MSAQFQVDTERIQAASADISRISAEIEGQVGAMMSRLTALQDAWRGSAAARFQGVVGEWQGTQRHVKEALDHVGQLLAQAGATYAETEAAAERMFV
jgi:WXG100 family type VII secretion target